MIKSAEKIIIVKVAITLRLLLDRNKNFPQTLSENENIINSYEKISNNSSSDLTKATVNAAFSGKKRSAMTTVVLIVESMGFTMIDFSEQYSQITDGQILDFQNNILNKKS
ncbi:hypothetical protein [uncultured Chryseobacterium sp.]|uniref:hypothetical protein n=1 Tax=uncultured Chryseobacterium sp. TaxID=259322 RepID=UPI0025FCD94A|nr:hypothetical protein [uncultured Chryseobacterium sp.]